MSSSSAAAAALAESNRRNAELRGSTGDTTYLREWKRFKVFVEEKRKEGLIPPGDKYLYRETVDLYSSMVIANLKCTPKVARRIRPALQFYANEIEYLEEKFCVESDHMTAAFRTQETTYAKDQLNIRIDPHSNLPINNLTTEEHQQALTTIFNTNHEGWRSLASSWILGNNSFIRCDTFINLKLSSLVFNYTHGPLIKVGEVERRLPMVAFVLNPTDMKGGRSNSRPGGSQQGGDGSGGKGKIPRRKAAGRKRVTGCWRHSNYLQCGVGMTAMSLFTKLFHDSSINFFDPGQGKKPMWWNLKIWNEWKDTRVAGTAYSRLLDKCGISWGKIIHMRAAGIEYAGSVGGLDQAAVATMSKHQQSVMDKVYMTELYGPLLMVMAGFKVNDIYHVPRSAIVLPWPLDQVCSCVFPRLSTWQSHYHSPTGDHSKAAENFLFQLLPFLAQVVAQDGIYWVRDFPNHQISRMLLQVMPPNYQLWAQQTRKKIAEDALKVNEVLASNLNTSTKAAMVLLMDTFKDSYSTFTNSVKDEINQMEMRLNGKIKEAIKSSKPQQHHNHPSANAQLQNQAEHEIQLPTQQQMQLPTQHEPQQNQPSLSPPPHIPNTPQRTFHEVLRNTPKQPVFPPSLPSTILELEIQYQENKLSVWENVKMTGWESKLKMSFGRRKYVHGRVKQNANRLHHGTFDQRLKRSAENMDEDRKSRGMSTSQYVRFLKQNDSHVSKRKKV